MTFFFSSVLLDHYLDETHSLIQLCHFFYRYVTVIFLVFHDRLTQLPSLLLDETDADCDSQVINLDLASLLFN